MAIERDPSKGRSAAFPDMFDLLMGSLHGLPDVTQTQQSTIQVVTPLVGNAETWILQTCRQADIGDTIFLQLISRDRAIRLVIPPKAAAVIARQYDSLGAMNRRKGARQAVETRKAKGIVPAWQRAGAKIADQVTGRKRRRRTRRKAVKS